MTGFEAASLYVGLFVLFFLWLKLHAGARRVGMRIDIGDGGDEALQRRMRVQANATEDVPITLIGLMALAGLSAPVMLIHTLGGGFFVFRLAHAFGLSRTSAGSLGRFIGTTGSMLVMLVTGLACLWYVLN